MFFRTAFAVAATAASMVLAQEVTIPEYTLNQCATSTLSYTTPGGSYYVAIVPANDACSAAPFAEFHDVSSGSIDYTPAIPSGTQVQLYVTGADGSEHWSGVITVGDGDAACLTTSSSSSAAASTSTSSSSSASVASAASAYVVPANNVASPVYRPLTTPSSSNSDSELDTPANAAANGASSVTASITLIGAALFAAAALL